MAIIWNLFFLRVSKVFFLSYRKSIGNLFHYTNCIYIVLWKFNGGYPGVVFTCGRAWGPRGLYIYTWACVGNKIFQVWKCVGKKSGNRNVLMGSGKMCTQGREEAIKRVGAAVIPSGEKAAGAKAATKGRRQKWNFPHSCVWPRRIANITEFRCTATVWKSTPQLES